MSKGLIFQSQYDIGWIVEYRTWNLRENIKFLQDNLPQMRKALLLLFAVILFLITSIASAGEYEDAMADFRIGNYKSSLKKLIPLARQGNVDAQYILGGMFEYGQGFTQDYVKAVKWYRLAAQQGNVFAQYNLGIHYRDGRGVKKDLGDAFKWTQKAADQGYSAAQNNMGFMYQNGEGIERDLYAAVGWWRRAAQQGNLLAQYNLGAAYSDGTGVPQDNIKALMWFSVSADQGDKESVAERDALKQHMADDQIEQARQLAADCKDRNYKDCD